MKILFVLENTMDNLEGGTEVSSRHLAGLLRKQGVEVEEWSPFNARRPIFWYTSVFGQLYTLIVLFWKFMKDRVQIVHIQGKYLVPPAVLIGKIFKIRTVATIRDYIVVCPIGLCLFHKGFSLRVQGESLKYYRHTFLYFLSREVPLFLSIYHRDDYLMIRIIRYFFLVRGWFMTMWLRFWLKQADEVVAVSKYVQRVLDANEIKSEVIYNVFNPDFALESNKVRPCLPRRQAGHGKVEPLNTILFVGKPSYGKGYDLFRSLSHNKLFEKYKFVTIGGDNKLPYMATLQTVKEASVVVVPSRWQEPFGRVALEAIMLGTPVVATSRGGLTEIVEDTMTGYTATPTENSLTRSLLLAIEKNRMLRKNIVAERKKLVEKFQSTPVKQHLTLYKSLLC